MSEPTIINLNQQRLTKEELNEKLKAYHGKTIHSLLLDENNVRKIENYEICKKHLIQLSLARNQLARTGGLGQFLNLRVLNLSCNMLIQLDCIQQLRWLEWLSVASNQLRSIDVINQCPSLVHVDASDNQLTELPALNQLKQLKTLLLHQNLIHDLKKTEDNIPRDLEILSLADNEIGDLRQVKHLKSLEKLDQLSLMKNFCVGQSVNIGKSLSLMYRAFVLSQCKGLSILDGTTVKREEWAKVEKSCQQAFDQLCEVETVLEPSSGGHMSPDFRLKGGSLSGDRPSAWVRNLNQTLLNTIHKNQVNNSADKPKVDVAKFSPTRSVSPGPQQHANQITNQLKRKRVQAWLGQQIEPHASVTSNNENDDAAIAEVTSQVGTECTDHDIQLLSESEFIAGDDLPFTVDLFTPPPNHVARQASVSQSVPIYEDIGDTSASFSKYEEYEMRPIKPLNTAVQLEMYGAGASHAHATPKPRPQPLKKHSGATSRHDVSRLRNSMMVEHSPANGRSSTVAARNGEGACTNGARSRVSDTSSYSRPIKKQTNFNPGARSPVKKTFKRDLDKSPHNPYNKKNLMKHLGSNYATSSKHQDDKGRQKTAAAAAQQERSDARRLNANRTYTVLHLTSKDTRHVKAATRIQAAWRGYVARHKNLRVLDIRNELRSRRSEQYIRLLCDEVQALKSKLNSERKLREMQVEALRFMWDQVHELQKKQKDEKPRNDFGESKSTDEGAGSETETVINVHFSQPNSPKQKPLKSGPVPNGTADDSGADYYQTSPATNGESSDLVLSNKKSPRVDAKELLATGASVDSVASMMNDNNALKHTVDQLQMQVLHLQEALLSFSDRLVVANNEPTAAATRGEDGDGHDARSDVPCPSAFADELQLEVPPSTSSDSVKDDVITRNDDVIEKARHNPDGYMLSARDDMPKLSIKDILVAIESALSERELWSICEQAALAMNAKLFTPIKCVSLDTVCIRKDGVISFSPNQSDSKAETTYLAPEILDDEACLSIKSCVFGMSVTLWSSADWRLAENQAPKLSATLESLLVAMSHDEPGKRCGLPDILTACEEFHSRESCNSLEVCASIFMEAASGLRHRRHLATTPLRNWKDFQDEMAALRKKFSGEVIPEIAAAPAFALKPALERKLAPAPVLPLTPHERLMSEIGKGVELRKVEPPPRVFSLQDLFRANPELVQTLSVLPGQRRKNLKTMQLGVRWKEPHHADSPLRPGIPTAPRQLRAELRPSPDQPTCSVVLRWTPSHFQGVSSPSKREKLVGYRIYVNRQPKGMVAGGKSRALLDGLRKSNHEYRVHVCAVSALGESEPSNTCIVSLCDPLPPQALDVKSSPVRSTNPERNSPTRTCAADDTRNSPDARPSPAAQPSAGNSLARRTSPERRTSPTRRISPERRTSPTRRISPAKAKGSTDDIVSRVLSRYGIPNTQTSAPAADHDVPPPDASPRDDSASTEKPVTGSSSCSSSENITPRSKALLDQLKDELLQHG